MKPSASVHAGVDWRFFVLPVLLLADWACAFAETPSAAEKYPAAAHAPASQPGWKKYILKFDPSAPEDEPQGGKTAAGTEITPRVEQCFPAESRNVFSKMDMVASGPNGELQPINYDVDGDGQISDEERNAIRGQNTWVLWGEGNETFWNWLQEKGYGIADFLILLDSRERESRFKTNGLINQPGMKRNASTKVLGLYLDTANGDAIKLTQPLTDIDSRTGQLAKRPEQPKDATHTDLPLFKVGDKGLYDGVIKVLPDDGVDPTVYGYASGIIGLRLMPNPDFFGIGEAAKRAREYWTKQVVNAPDDSYYTDAKIYEDPALVRPFRVSMSCAFCHVGPHPLNPPANVEAPEWENLSSTIGNQYWAPERAFANLAKPTNFLYHYVKSQQPGTIDTSLVSTDWINNANTINSIFSFPAREARAMLNDPEEQGPANLLMRSLESPLPGTNPRKFPRVLVDGSDSVGAFAALMRVYLNIGTFSEEWGRCHNPIIGYKLQHPFSVATLEKNSVYWRTAERYRIPYLAAFFQHRVKTPPVPPGTGVAPVVNEVTAPMKLGHTPQGREIIARESALAQQGRQVFLENCAICHSSKQPDGYALNFSRDWRRLPALKEGDAPQLVAPMDFQDWEAFKHSDSYREYLRQLLAFAGPPDPDDAFMKDNFLSNEVRIPVTLTGTNSGRAVATNAMRGQVWDNFSSEGYKELAAVGDIPFYNPYSGDTKDISLMNDRYAPPGGGPGYYRTPSLVSLWATAPYLHNNALGMYNRDPSVPGRLAAFEDGIGKLLNQKLRKASPAAATGDLRWTDRGMTKGDPGFIYRTPQVTAINIPGKYVRQLLTGVVGGFAVSVLTFWLWVVLGLIFAVLTFTGIPRQAGFVFFTLALLSSMVIAIARLYVVSAFILLAPILLLGVALYLWLGIRQSTDTAGKGLSLWALITPARVSMALLLLLTLLSGVKVNGFVAGQAGPLSLGPIPRGTPVNLLMNLNPEAPLGLQVDAVGSLMRGMLVAKPLIDRGQDEKALEVFQREAGLPLLKASKCPDYVLDRGHWFGESLLPAQDPEAEKRELTAFLKTL